MKESDLTKEQKDALIEVIKLLSGAIEKLKTVVAG